MFQFVSKIAVSLGIGCLVLSGCSPQWVKEQVKARVVERRATRKKADIPTRFEWRSRPEVPKAGLPALWSLKVLDLRTDPVEPKGIRAYESPHAVAMHLFVVSRDLSHYAHLYPEPRDYGNFLTRVIAPVPGSYQLFADYTPIDGFAKMNSQRFIVAGDSVARPQPLTPTKAKAGWLETVATARKEENFEAPPGENRPTYLVRMQAAPWRAKRTQTVRTHVLDSNRAPLEKLQLHLNGAGYGVAISQDGNTFVRLEPVSGADAKTEEYTGANAIQEANKLGYVDFTGTFPTPGLYKIWLEFRHNDQLIVAPFVVRVAPA